MERPNVIFYLTNQQGWGTIGCYGQKLNVTPNLDRLAGDGVVSEEAYTAQPVCRPCRALFQTGKYPLELGCYKNNIALPPDVKTMADCLEESGYETTYVRRWHLTSGGSRYGEEKDDYKTNTVPLNRRDEYRGFWRASGVLGFTSHGYGGYVFDENGNRHDFTGYQTDCIMDYVLEFLDGYDRKGPFFMTISQIEPHHRNNHDRYEGPGGSKERFREFELPPDSKLPGGNAAEECPDYLGCCGSLDENLGWLVEKLREKGLHENTVIVFASDHGSHFKTRNQDEHLNGYNDYKRSCHSGRLRMPLVIAGSGWRGGRRIKNLVSTAGLPKAWLAMAGIDVEGGMIGEDLRDVADGRDAGWREETYAQISEGRVGRRIRTPEYLYAVYAPGMDGRETGHSGVYWDNFLYDLRKNPYELVNMVYEGEYRAVRDKMAERLLALVEETGESGARIQM